MNIDQHTSENTPLAVINACDMMTILLWNSIYVELSHAVKILFLTQVSIKWFFVRVNISLTDGGVAKADHKGLVFWVPLSTWPWPGHNFDRSVFCDNFTHGELFYKNQWGWIWFHKGLVLGLISRMYFYFGEFALTLKQPRQHKEVNWSKTEKLHQDSLLWWLLWVTE